METSNNYGYAVKHEFYLDQDYVFVNHGSYGVVPKKVQHQQYRFMEERETNTGAWFNTKAFALWKTARDAIAKFVGANSENVVFVQNATTGINTILKAYPWQPGDGILVTDVTYRAIQNACRKTASLMKDAHLVFLEFKFPIESEDQILDMYDNILRKHPKIKMAVIDHIISPTAMKMPVEKLVKICRGHGVLSLVDGAHAPGQVKLNIDALDADIYTGNLHKWLFTPRGCAILCIKKEHHDWCTPLVTSHNYKKGVLMEYFMQGTRDDIPYFVVPEALKFYESIGGLDKICNYTTSLLQKAVTLMTSDLKTTALKIPKSLEAPCMRLVKLPEIPGYEKSWTGSEKLFNDIRDKYHVDCVVYPVDGELYIRLSACVYNTEEDFKRVNDVFVDLIKGKD